MGGVKTIDTRADGNKTKSAHTKQKQAHGQQNKSQAIAKQDEHADEHLQS